MAKDGISLYASMALRTNLVSRFAFSLRSLCAALLPYSQQNTNVVELYSHIIKDGEQLTYYNSGIGTYAKESWFSFSYLWQVFINKIDLMIAWCDY